MTETVIAALATLFGAIGLKIFDSWWNRRTVKRERREAAEAEQLLKDQKEVEALRIKMEELQLELEKTEREVDEWKDKYWALREDFVSRIEKLTAISKGDFDGNL